MYFDIISPVGYPAVLWLVAGSAAAIARLRPACSGAPISLFRKSRATSVLRFSNESANR